MGKKPSGESGGARRAAIVTAFDPRTFSGGIERFTLHLAALIEAHGWSCDILFPCEGQRTPGFRNQFLAGLHALGVQVGRREFDLVVTNNFYGLALFPPKGQTVAVFHATHAGLAEATTGVVSRSTYLEWRLLWGEVGDVVSAFGRRTVAVSDAVRRELGSYYGIERVELVEHGVDTRLFHPRDRLTCRRELGLDPGKVVGLFVGRWDRLKGADVVAEVMRARPDVGWIVVTGTGGTPDALPANAMMSLHEVREDVLPTIYGAADFLFTPSRYEGFGLVVLEALACGTPPITTPVGLAASLFRDGPFGQMLLPPPAAPVPQLAASGLARMEAVTRQAELRQELVEWGLATVRRSYTLNAWQERMEKALGFAGD